MLIRAAFALALGVLLPGYAAAQFFPPGTLSGSPASWRLSTMDEPSLWKMAAEKAPETYRFTWLRSFHAPFVFRLEVRADKTGSLVVKSTSHKGGDVRLVLNKNIPLDRAQVRRFASALDEVGFWNLPTNELSHSGLVGLDGAQWVFEGVKGGRYHVIDRWSPKGGMFRKLMLDLMALGGVRGEPIY
jgi:hypothetical protein